MRVIADNDVGCFVHVQIYEAGFVNIFDKGMEFVEEIFGDVLSISKGFSFDVFVSEREFVKFGQQPGGVACVAEVFQVSDLAFYKGSADERHWETQKELSAAGLENNAVWRVF